MKTISNFSKALFFTVAMLLTYTTAQSQSSLGPYATGINADSPRMYSKSHVKSDNITSGNSFDVPLEVAIIITSQNDNSTVLQAYNLNSSSDLMFQSGAYTIVWYHNGHAIGTGPIVHGPACGTIRVEVLDNRGGARAQATTNLGLCQVTLNDNK